MASSRLLQVDTGGFNLSAGGSLFGSGVTTTTSENATGANASPLATDTSTEDVGVEERTHTADVRSPSQTTGLFRRLIPLVV